jgi:hypothetical protein
MKRILALFLVVCGVIAAPAAAGAVDIEATPMEQNTPAAPEKEKQDLTIGPRDLQKEKPRGVWVNFLVGEKASVGCGLSIYSRDSDVQSRQRWNSGIYDTGGTQVEGCVGFKYQFK